MRFSAIALLLLELGEFEETFWQQLSDYQKQIRDNRLPRHSVRKFEHSPWLFMYRSGCDQALSTMTGLTHAAFSKLLRIFIPYWNMYVMDKVGNIHLRKKPGSKIGRPRQLPALGGLGLVLTWYKTKGARSKNLAMQFGLTSSPMAYWLWFSMCCLRSALVHHPEAKVISPTAEEVEIYKSAISAKYPSLQNVWAAVDGIKLRVSEAEDWNEQITHYNGWTHGHYVNNIFCFAPDGKIRICVLNCPGSWHDSTMSHHGAYQKMSDVYEKFGGQVVVDSAFRIMRGSDGNDMFIKSSQVDHSGGPRQLVMHREATSVRQLAEWGMRMIQAQYPRLTDVLPLEDDRRQAIIHLAVLLYNFTTAEVGINQILNTYFPFYGDGEGEEFDLFQPYLYEQGEEFDFFQPPAHAWNNI